MFASLIIPTLAGLLGAIVGGFLALVTVRLPLDEEVIATRSGFRSRSPLVSPRYVSIELAAAAIGVWAALNGGGILMIAATAILGWQLLLIALIDAENFWLPDSLTLPLIATGLVASALLSRAVPWSQLIGAGAGFVSLWGLARLYKVIRRRDGLGGGDPVLFAGAGAWVGVMGLPSVLLYGCLVAAAVVAVRLIARRSVAGTDRLPFGSLLAIGIWLTWLYGPVGAGAGA